MRILAINIQNFRKLLQCHIDFSKKITLFVGANNSGKHLLWMLLANSLQIGGSLLTI